MDTSTSMVLGDERCRVCLSLFMIVSADCAFPQVVISTVIQHAPSSNCVEFAMGLLDQIYGVFEDTKNHGGGRAAYGLVSPFSRLRACSFAHSGPTVADPARSLRESTRCNCFPKFRGLIFSFTVHPAGRTRVSVEPTSSHTYGIFSLVGCVILRCPGRSMS
jgi:hypothetical protein